MQRESFRAVYLDTVLVVARKLHFCLDLSHGLHWMCTSLALEEHPNTLSPMVRGRGWGWGGSGVSLQSFSGTSDPCFEILFSHPRLAPKEVDMWVGELLQFVDEVVTRCPTLEQNSSSMSSFTSCSLSSSSSSSLELPTSWRTTSWCLLLPSYLLSSAIVVITISIICLNTVIVIVVIPCLFLVFAIMQINIFFHVNLSHSLLNGCFVKLSFG